MASIDLNTMKTWNDRDVITAAQYDAERNKIITAVNDNAAQITGMSTNYYDKPTIDQKFQNVATTATIASGTAFPGSAVAGQPFYRTDLKALFAFSATDNQWELNMKAGTGVTVEADGTVSINPVSFVGDGLSVANGAISARDLLWQIHMGIGGF